jgi:hypothetical protein
LLGCGTKPAEMTFISFGVKKKDYKIVVRIQGKKELWGVKFLHAHTHTQLLLKVKQSRYRLGLAQRVPGI